MPIYHGNVPVVTPQAPVRWLVQGTLAQITKLAQSLIDQSMTIARVRAWVDTSPGGSPGDIILDLNVNGVSIWNVTPSNRLTILAGQNSGVQTTFDNANVAAGDRLSLDVDQVGGTTPGGDDLLVLVEFV